MAYWKADRAERAAQTRDLTILALLATIAGMAGGAVCAAFRWCLDHGENLRRKIVDHAHDMPDSFGILILVFSAAALAALSAWMVRRFAPAAEGSGIPHAEAVLAGHLPPSHISLIPIKFFGGIFAMASGLALGREGPSVQMAASVANLVGRIFRREWSDRRALIAGGAGAGLATAFNAPGAGAVFVLEELVGKFDVRIALVALGASAGAIIVSRSILGDELVFVVSDMSSGGMTAQLLFLALGLFAGMFSVVYSRVMMWVLRMADKFPGPVELRAALIGGTVGLTGWFAPHLVGSGENLAQSALNAELLWTVLPALFLFRLLLGSASYAAATPGGLFAPMLALGAIAGLGFGQGAAAIFPDMQASPAAFALVGMGALFAGVVRAPVTGIILVTEMTGASSLLLPLLSGCFGAMLVVEAIGEKPIYDSLSDRSSILKR